jgi:hypothetical protein
MLNGTPGKALVLYCRVFEPGGNNPDLEALEPLTSKSFASMIFGRSPRVLPSRCGAL